MFVMEYEVQLAKYGLGTNSIIRTTQLVEAAVHRTIS